MEPLEQLLEKDKQETGASTEEKKEEKKEEKIEEKTEDKVEGSEEKKEEKKEDPWYKELEFEDENQVKEFVKSNKNKVPELPKFASPSAEAYNNWVANGGVDDYSVFQAVNKFSASETPTPEEMVKALVLKQTIEEPEYRGEESILESQIKKKYGLSLKEEDIEHMDEDEKAELKLKLIDLKKEFKKTTQYFGDMKSKATVKVDEALETRLKEGPAKLKEHLEKLVTNYKVDIPKRTKGEKGEVNFADSFYSINFDESMQKSFKETYQAIAKDKKFPDLADGSHKELEAIAAGWTLINNFQNIANDIYEAGLAAGKSGEIEKEIKDTNPSAVGTHEKKSTSTEVKDKSGDIFK